MPAEIVTDGLPEPAEDFKGRVEDAASATEKHLIREALEKAGGNRTRAAGKLGISRRTLYKKMKEYNL
jgi:transcriptional regulator with PAS, ATPase and Fis domain